MIAAVLAGILGLLIGSFLNVCIHRLPRDLSVIRPRSHCPECERPIAWYDNVPVVSYVLLGGKCRHCGWGIPWRYPLVELATGALFFAAVRLHGPEPLAWKLCLLAALLVELSVSDLETRILPDEFTLGGTVLGVALAFWVPMPAGLVSVMAAGAVGQAAASAAEAAAGAAFTGGALWLVGWLYQKVRKREGLGFGDVKLVALIGAFLGLQGTLLALILGSVAGSVIGVVYIWLAKKQAASYELPYGTFLGAGALAVAFGGPFFLP